MGGSRICRLAFLALVALVGCDREASPPAVEKRAEPARAKRAPRAESPQPAPRPKTPQATPEQAPRCLAFLLERLISRSSPEQASRFAASLLVPSRVSSKQGCH